MLIPQTDNMVGSDHVKAQRAAAEKVAVAPLIEEFKQFVQLRTKLLVTAADDAVSGEAYCVLPIGACSQLVGVSLRICADEGRRPAALSHGADTWLW